MSILTITLPGLEVLGRPLDGSPPDGVYLGPDGFEGWDDTPDMRRETVQRVAAAGDFDATGYADARVVSLSGLIVSPSEDRTQYWTERLTGVLSGGTTEKITVRRSGTVRFASGGLVKTKVVTRARARHIADWQMQLWFPDPLKYGDLHVSEPAVGGGDSVTIVHYGNTWATSLLTITGSDADGYVIVGPGGRRIDVNAPLTAGTPHTFDTATGLLRVGGSIRYGALGRADLWRTAPGRPTSVGVGSTGATTKITATTWDTYI